MDVIKPDLMWLEGCCFRITSSDEPYMRKQENLEELYAEDDEFDNTTCNSEELFDDFEVETTEAGRFRTSFHVPRVYFPYVIGQKGNTRRRLENETKTQIRVPKMGQDGDIIITGTAKKGVCAARRRIDLIVMSARQKQQFTHFISIPMTIEIFTYTSKHKLSDISTLLRYVYQTNKNGRNIGKTTGPDKSPILNLSEYNLSKHEIDVLPKGVSIFPHTQFDNFALVQDVLSYACTLRLEYFFQNKSYTYNLDEAIDPSFNYFKPPSDWDPPLPSEHPLEQSSSLISFSLSPVNIYNTIICLIVHSGSETWTTRKTDRDKLDIFKRRVGSSERVEGGDREQTKKTTVQWVGHVARMLEDAIPSIDMFEQISEIDNEVPLDKEILQEGANTPLSNGSDVNPLLQGTALEVQMVGLEYMNDDPAEVDILYGKKQYTQVKLHVTLMNTLFRTDRGIESDMYNSKDRQKARESFDATNILKMFENYDFGTHIVNEIDLSQRYSSDKRQQYLVKQSQSGIHPIYPGVDHITAGTAPACTCNNMDDKKMIEAATSLFKWLFICLHEVAFDPILDSLLQRNILEVPGIRPGTSESVARNSDPSTTEAIIYH
uniref:K Homology domain-containing protein n=1 Tax=Timema monikensis TaxID=170555 RepID=A0A7R9EH75_9NEOP|nr:unnamed protein product [Timema monikensis]